AGSSTRPPDAHVHGIVSDVSVSLNATEQWVQLDIDLEHVSIIGSMLIGPSVDATAMSAHVSVAVAVTLAVDPHAPVRRVLQVGLPSANVTVTAVTAPNAPGSIGVLREFIFVGLSQALAHTTAPVLP